MSSFKDKLIESTAWKNFCTRYNLSEKLQNQYSEYMYLLVDENEQYNLTAITNTDDMINYHLDDALRLSESIDLNSYNGIADIGSGCGVPGLMLALYHPHIQFYLIEILNKRISFLEYVCDKLKITNCTIINMDFKSIVRKGPFQADLFLARASLSCADLLFLYSGNSKYKKSDLIYWATGEQNPSELIHGSKYENQAVSTTYPYQVGSKKRAYFKFTSI